jgi:hypothetical protein
MPVPSKNNPFGEPTDVDWEGAETIEVRSTKEVKIPEHVYPFKPRPYQKAVFGKIKSGRYDEFKLARSPYTVGVDLGEKGGDKSVIATAMMGHNGKVHIWYDEYSEWPNYKWYRHPLSGGNGAR